MHVPDRAESRNHIHSITTFEDRDGWLEMLLASDDLAPSAKVVGASIAIHIAPATGRCEKSREALADACAMDARTVRRMIHQLEVAGLLAVDRTVGHFANTFRLKMPACTEPAAAPSIGGSHV
jgi:uncharacterized protein (DUF2336 family)